MYPTLPENDPTTNSQYYSCNSGAFPQHGLSISIQFNSNSWTWILQKSFFTLVSKERKLSEHKDTNGGWQNYKDFGMPVRISALSFSSNVRFISLFIENYDQSRVVSHFRSESEGWRAIPAKVLAIL